MSLFFLCLFGTVTVTVVRTRMLLCMLLCYTSSPSTLYISTPLHLILSIGSGLVPCSLFCVLGHTFPLSLSLWDRVSLCHFAATAAAALFCGIGWN
ncbi:hypothetical protein BZA05DRAFT_386958 [Tricharina praecox]|uniref:uncharacterized protein n=1 Tax=Tricharina praecox TaxID=43433 RepID=UPI00221F35E6|nr:uncharacterized protein BZA05DRAFT_386958 [Tricharina praecox]KAI5857000.1 hypothetical protein BZA05DRAFT_386958 [Tricharina praecox]